MTTQVPMTRKRVGNNEVLRVILEETVHAEYDIGSSGDYVNVSQIEGRLLIEPAFNRGELVEVVQQAENIPISDKIRMLLDGWEHTSGDNYYELNYGTLIFRGTEPLSLDDTLDVSLRYARDSIQNKSPEKLRNDMRTEISYESTYDKIAANTEEYLRNNGIAVDQVNMGVPLHIQAKAEPIANKHETGRKETGIEFDIILENKSHEQIQPSTVTVDMPPRIGRGVKVDTDSDLESGSYNPESESYEFDLNTIPAESTQVVTFTITQQAKGELNELDGEVLFEKATPFTDLKLEGFYDAGGIKGDRDIVDIRSSGSFVTSFTADTSDILVGGQQEIQKNFSVKGITPQRAMEKLSAKLKQRNIGADRQELEEAEKLADDSVQYNGSFTDGAVMQGETKIYIDITVQGTRKVAQKQRGTTNGETDETLPDVQRQTTTEYGQVGISINATGNNLEKVDGYATELRKDLQLDLESIAEEI